MSLLAWSLSFPPASTGRAEVTVENLSLHSGEERVRAVLYRPAGKGPFPGLLVLHGDFGPTEWVKKQARRLAGKGYVSLVVDLYHGEVPKDLEEAHILERALPAERVRADVKAAIDHLAGRPDVRKNGLGVIGWDMGGGYALEAVAREPRLRAAVVCYGRLITDAKLLAGMRAAVLGIFAAKDEGITPDTLDRFRAAMKKAGKRLSGLHVFPGVENGLMDPDSPYRTGPASPAAIAAAWQKIDAFLAKQLASDPPAGVGESCRNRYNNRGRKETSGVGAAPACSVTAKDLCLGGRLDSSRRPVPTPQH
jgi:carboxymethylenebutenolidase